jgi:uncharacterized protein YndB with AHSA1/START domain
MEPVSLHRHVELDITTDALWDLVADPARLADWLGDSVDVELAPGNVGRISDDGIERFVHIDRVDHGRSLGFTWWETPGDISRVEFEIAALPDGGSRLEITETFVPPMSATSEMSASATATATASQRWEVRVCALWACTVVAALVQ